MTQPDSFQMNSDKTKQTMLLKVFGSPGNLTPESRRSGVETCRGMGELNPVYVRFCVGSNIEQNMSSEKVVIILSISILYRRKSIGVI